MAGWQPTRAAGAARLAAFAPRAGTAYARGRNTDFGPGAPAAVSGLSPYIRRRLVTEAEAVAAARAAHGAAADSFVDEVLWRGYFKGWLQQRPQVWEAYRAGLAADLAALAADRRAARAVAAAEAGETGIACLDAWAQELAATGYLHNHARMWFASIWIFTLGLPWRLGADLFLRRLLDGDPASNTLGWRWVAGLHTRGKAYRADPDNIARHTAGRFRPRPGELAETVAPLDATEPAGWPPLGPIPAPDPPRPGVPTLLLVAEDDCRPEDFGPAALDLVGIATLAGSHLRSPLPVASAVAAFEAGALADAAGRLQAATGLTAAALTAGDPDDLARHAARLGARQIALAEVPVGPLADWLAAAGPALARAGIARRGWQRDWDAAVWPHATAGFFRVRAAKPAILAALGLP